MKIIIALPAYNEEMILEKTVTKLVDFCQKNLALDWQIIIADNNSTDQTAVVAKSLAEKFNLVSYLFVAQKGKGMAIKTAWENSEADFYSFMDADLATDLSALPPALAALQGGFDAAIGSRFAKGSVVTRSLVRRLTSQGYRLVLKILLGLKVNDAPCGFKLITKEVKNKVLPQIKNRSWFFDSELIIIAEKQGYKIKEIPVIWQDPREGRDKSRVNTIALSQAYLKQVLALRRRFK
jgi:glycosyltransferase involved in cell wall biosynthesis